MNESTARIRKSQQKIRESPHKIDVAGQVDTGHDHEKQGQRIVRVIQKQDRRRIPFFLMCLLLTVLLIVYTEYHYLSNFDDDYDSLHGLFSPVVTTSEEMLKGLSSERRERYEAVRKAIKHAWDGYRSTCLQKQQRQSIFGLSSINNLGLHIISSITIPSDDLMPIKNEGSDWLHYAATLHDSLDTLYLAGLNDEYEIAVSMVLEQDIQTTSLKPTKTFEYSIRVIGGLLGAYSVTGDSRLLKRARYAADSLLDSPFKSSPTALPRMYDVLFPPTKGSKIIPLLYKVYARLYQWGRDQFTNEHHTNSLAGVGSFSLEFNFLSVLTNDPKYKKVTDDIHSHVSASFLQDEKKESHSGIVSNLWNVMTGEPSGYPSGLGSGCDSYYEYLLKVPLWANCENIVNQSEDVYYDNCDDVHRSMLIQYKHIIKNSLRSKYVYNFDDENATNSNKGKIAFPVDQGNIYQHLLCFVPGMVALGASTTLQSDHDGDDMELAKKLLRGCYEMYRRSPTLLGPEQIRLRKKQPLTSTPPLGDRRYQLRPEYVESLFILYRLTGDETYQEMGWEVFESLNRYCKTVNGFTGLKDVYSKEQDAEARIDEMPSFFIAETLKYLLLLFGPDNYMPLDEYIFTTEAHPIRKVKVKDLQLYQNRRRQKQQQDNHREIISVPVPWPLILCISLVFVLSSSAMFVIYKLFCHCYNFFPKKQRQKSN